MNKELNIVLVFRTGGKFRLRDVLLLASQLQKKRGTYHVNTFCLTDVVKEKTEIENIVLLPMQNEWEGWWSKMNLFSPDLEYLRPFLYLDLDTAVLKPLSSFLLHDLPRSSVIMLRDFYKQGEAASGIMWIPAKNEKISLVWKSWLANPKKHMNRYKGDQNFIRSIIRPDSFFQDITQGIVSYKPGRRHRTKLKGDEAIVCFHGKPKIRDAANNVDWIDKYIKKEI